MARKCSSCGAPAPDGESRFCNRCGASIVDEPEPQFPVCGTCGASVADPQAQFCDKCGGPIRKAITACPSCGNPAVDENSKFCTRCGATFTKPGTCPSCGFANPEEAGFCNRCGAALRATVAPAAAPPSPAPSVVLTKKRVSLPVPEETPSADWDPWSDTPSEQEVMQAAPQIRVPQKKYSHLPLIADELKDYKKPPAGIDDYPASAEPAPRKKGVLGFKNK